MDMTDVLIIGGGPAGLSAALHIRARGKTCVVLGNPPTDSPLAKAKRVDNYPGLRGISGRDLVLQMRREAEQAGAEFVEGRVLSVAASGNGFLAATQDQILEGRRVILAIGAAMPKPLKGERELLGHGVSYCATCDGMLYRGKRVVVMGNAPQLAKEAEFLQRIGVSVTVLTKKPLLLAEGIPSRVVRSVELIGENGRLVAVSADGERLDCDGVFLLRPMLAPDALVNGLKLDNGYIAVDRKMHTNIQGLYAAGDCTGQPLQIAKAVGEGQMAASEAAEEE